MPFQEDADRGGEAGDSDLVVWYVSIVRAELTARELEVLALLAQGKSNQEIAQRLNISIHTVFNHCHKIYEKLGVRSRGEAAAIALLFDLVSIDIDEIIHELGLWHRYS